ncbi:MAG: Tripartite tricarboxylate transporter TctA family protein [Blastococcus sp.]|nr:Tripartite tricarboxylate transporter TctA family protein [Blastococcus sp.]
MSDALLSALGQVLTLTSISMILLGVLLGFVVGVLPGLGGAVMLALLLPFTYSMEPIPAFALLLGMYIVAATAGDITSILFGVPGEASAAAVVLDGYPLARRGQAGRALGAALSSSFVGTIVGLVVLVALIPVVRPIIINTGPPEFFGLALLGLTFVVTLSSGQLVKGMVACLMGALISLVGLAPSSGIPRFTFGSVHLWDGVSIIAVVIGLFGGAEVLQLMMRKGSVSSVGASASAVHGLREGVNDTARHWTLAVRGGAIGSAIGILPGLGGTVAQFLAYGHAKQVSKKPEEFGKGSIEGVIAASATGVAKDTGALIPTVAFGIPGSAGAAVLLGAFLILGLDPGKEMLTTNLDVTMSFVWITLFATIGAVALGVVMARPLAKLTHISGPLLVPFLLLLLSLGAFSESNSFIEILLMLLFVALGVGCIRWDWPRVPLLLGFVLGPVLERYLFLSNSVFGSSWLTRPQFLAIMGCVVLVLALPLFRLLRARMKRGGDGPTAGGSISAPDSTGPASGGTSGADRTDVHAATTTGVTTRTAVRPEPGTVTRVRVAHEIVGGAVLAVFFGGAFWIATGWDEGDALFPLGLSGLACALCVLFTARSALLGTPVVTPPAPVAATEDNPDAPPVDDDVEYVFRTASGRTWAQTLAFFGGFFVLLYLFGAFAAAAIFSTGYLRSEDRRSWKFSLLYGAVVVVVLYVLFTLALGQPLPTGLIGGF